jgi:tRNA wybutosine-synthesizing protein 2
LDVLDKHAGGWIHVHENFAVKEIESKAEDVRKEFQHMVDCNGRSKSVELEYINRLKSYAPGVIHCVLDLHIPPPVSA